MDDRNHIAHLEDRLARLTPEAGAADLELLADLYLQSEHYLPALETIDRLLSLSEARELSDERRLALECKAVSCRIARGEAQAALAHCRELMPLAERQPARGLLTHVHLLTAWSLRLLGRFEESRLAAEVALRLSEEAGDLHQVARALLQIGIAAYREGDIDQAAESGEQALALFRRLGDAVNVAHARNNLGLVHKQRCQWSQAEAHFQAALATYREHALLADAAGPLANLGVVLQKRGAWDPAAEAYREAESICLRVGADLRAVSARIGLGNVARLRRRFAEAETLLLGALESARQLGGRREQALALEFLGELDHERDRTEHALGRYRDALRLAEQVAPEGDLVVEIERRRAESFTALGRFEDADTSLGIARRIARRIDERLEHAITFRVQGELALRRGMRAEALEAWATALRQLDDCHESFESARVHLLIGRAIEDSAAARAHLFQACGTFAAAGAESWLEEAEAALQRRFAGPAPVALRAEPGAGRRSRAPSLIAASPGMQHVEALARRAAQTDLSVLVTGETGTGKELMARTIHELSARGPRVFLAVNCGALRADLALSQLFGHRRGAFTGAHAEGVGLVEAANGGTLFLDEVGELPHDVQVTLLRFLESGEYLRLGETQVRRSDVRLIAATHRLLRGAEGEKLFRRDLLYRLNEIEIRLPSLRDRRDDILGLARHFLSFYGGAQAPALTPDAEALLLGYAWPGNVRELENAMKRVAALHAGDRDIDAAALQPFVDATATPSTPPAAVDERSRIIAAHREALGNKSRAAELLGISRKTLYQRLRKLGLSL